MVRHIATLSLLLALAPSPARAEEAPAQWPVAFHHALNDLDVVKEKFHICLGQYGGHIQVHRLLGLRIAGVHTLSTAWLDVPVADRYRLSFQFSLTKEGTLRLWLSGPGYGVSDCMGYGLRLGRDEGIFYRGKRVMARFDFPEKLELDRSYPMVCTREGAKITIHVGGAPAVEFVDPEPLAGVLHSRIGIGAHQGRGGTGVRFRDLELRRPPLDEEQTEALAEIRLIPPETIKPKEPIAPLFQATATQMTLEPWLHTQKHAVKLIDGKLFLGGPNAGPGCFRTKPLTGNFAFDTTFNYIKPVYPMPGWHHGISWQRNVLRRGGAALNLRILLFYADKPVAPADFAKFLKEPRVGWEILLPDFVGFTRVNWLQAGATRNMATTPYYTPLPGRTTTLRIEREGGRIRLFLDGRYLLDARQPLTLPNQDRLPLYYAVCQSYESVLIHNTSAHRIRADVAEF